MIVAFVALLLIPVVFTQGTRICKDCTTGDCVSPSDRDMLTNSLNNFEKASIILRFNPKPTSLTWSWLLFTDAQISSLRSAQLEEGGCLRSVLNTIAYFFQSRHLSGGGAEVIPELFDAAVSLLEVLSTSCPLSQEKNALRGLASGIRSKVSEVSGIGAYKWEIEEFLSIIKAVNGKYGNVVPRCPRVEHRTALKEIEDLY
ncbi:hypothetical protein NECAME_05903 [Necator americanus]|uniref:Uncharacterized protein n=1 Tax=Necator americanus TaxID=51031 RepID=W2TY40_NECAM|nr:hypothetical protein NECAME_05903 [Necator americanus]ETN86599.1 hypothetical protein NECAME_05903 [Necator americanus]